MLRVDNTPRIARDDASSQYLPPHQWKRTHVAAVEREHVECDERRYAAPDQMPGVIERWCSGSN